MKKSAHGNRANAGSSNIRSRPGGVGPDAGRLADAIMREDREILGALAEGQLATAREVMARRKRALRDLAKS